MSNEPQLEFLFKVSIETAFPHAIGENPYGNRQIIPVTGDHLRAPASQGRFFLGVGIGCLCDQMGLEKLMRGRPGRLRMVLSCM